MPLSCQQQKHGNGPVCVPFPKVCLSGTSSLRVHWQGAKRLGPCLRPMAYAEDGLIEAFFDPHRYEPPHGRFLVGLQFHPERMRILQDAQKLALAGEGGGAPAEEFEYPECPRVYEVRPRLTMKHACKLIKLHPRAWRKAAPSCTIPRQCQD